MNGNKNNRPIYKLKGLRAEHGYTQEQIADKLCISKATYARKENGICQFGADEISKLIDIFNVNYEYIFYPQS